MKITSLKKGRIITFPPSVSAGANNFTWTFQNMTDEDWTAVTIQTGPSSKLGTLYELAGGTGDPPNIRRYTIVSPRNRSAGTVNSESIRDFFQPVKQSETVSITLEFDDAFESPEYIDIVFFYRNQDNKLAVVSGTIVDGIALPRPDPGFTGDIVTGSLPFLTASSERPRSTGNGMLFAAATTELQKEVRDLRRQFTDFTAGNLTASAPPGFAIDTLTSETVPERIS